MSFALTKRPAMLLLAAAMLFMLAAPPAASARLLFLGTATEGGDYHPVGVEMAKMWSAALKTDGVRCKAVTTAGSQENAEILGARTGGVQLAFMQGMVVSMACKGQGPFKGKARGNIRSVASLWPDVEHWVIRADKAKTGTLADLRGLRLAMGRSGSGSYLVSTAVLDSCGPGACNVTKLEHGGYMTTVEDMKKGLVEAAEMSGLPPLPAVSEMFKVFAARPPVLISFTPQQINDLVSKTDYPGFAFDIPAKTYPGQSKAVHTVAQGNVLVCDAKLDDDTVYKLTKALFECQDPACKGLRGMSEMAYLTPDKAIKGLVAPLHPGAYRYYKEKGLSVPEALVPPAAK